MKKFNEFYLQKLFESVLEVDPDFYDILNRMPSEPISDKIFHWVADKKDIVTKYNFLSEDPKNVDKILFVPDNQYQRIKSQGQDPKTKTKSDSAIGRFARALMKDNNVNVSDPEIEKFVTNYKKLWTEKNSPPEFKIVKGDDILYWYNENNYYAGGRSTLGNSCMRQPERNYFMNLYAQNPEKISLAIITKLDVEGKEKLIARSLIWVIDDNKFFCDRIYYNDEPLLELMRTFVSQNISGEVIFHDKYAIPYLKVDLNKVKFDRYPYADSIIYVCFNIVSGQLSESGFVMSNSYYNRYQEELDKNYAIAVMQRTSGEPEYINFVYLSKYGKYYFKSETISWDEELHPKEQCKFSNYYRGGRYIPKYLVVYSKYLKDWIMKDSAIEHPKFGIVPNDYFIEVIISYNGNSVYPWDIMDDVERRGISAFETTQIPRKEPIDENLYFKSSYHSKVNNVEVVWSNDFKENDILSGGRFIPSIFSVDIVGLSDTNNVPSNYIIGSNVMIASDFKLLGLNKRLINRSGKTSFYYLVKDNFNKINYKNTIDRIKRSRRLTLEEKKWRKSLLDWCDSYYVSRSDFTYKIENGRFDFEVTINQIFDIHKTWYKRRFWINYDNYESYVNYYIARGSFFNEVYWSEMDDQIKKSLYEYIPKIQFIWTFIENTGRSRDYLKDILSKNAPDEYRKLSEFNIPNYTSFFGLIRDFLYSYEDNGISEFYDLLISELNIQREGFEDLSNYITELIKSGDLKQILNY
jgi:hypothetical protein